MIPVTVMVTRRGTVSYKIKGRFGPGSPSRFSHIFRPVIVWNMTYACNLRCIHCYIRAGMTNHNELKYSEALGLIDQISEVGSPLLILSGGEPLVRRDFMDIVKYASQQDINLVLSTNGTLISNRVASVLAETGFRYIGISIDSPHPEWHNRFRGVEGAFEKTVQGIKNCIGYGLPTGIRFTVTRYNVDEVPGIIDLAIKYGIMRITFYHLSAAGRALDMGRDWYMTEEQYRWFLNTLIDSAERLMDALEIETTLAPFDGIYIADKISRNKDEFLDMIELVRAQGGCGRKIVSIYPDGTVYPCQFVDFMRLGNIRETRLKDILSPHQKALEYFFNTEKYVREGKCRDCPFLNVCKGGDRIRAYYLGGSLYASDPQCHLNISQIYKKWYSE